MLLLSSACTVTTAEVLQEATFAVRSFTYYHPGIPVFVGCPPPLASKVADIDPAVVAVPLEMHTPGSVEVHNSFHRPDAILLKMGVMDAALNKFPDTLFFDADLTFLAPIPSPFGDCEVALSLNLSETRDMGETSRNYGVFNAGLLWTNSASFPSWWRNAYLSQSQKVNFYEQTCLSRACSSFRVGYFPHSVNYGFWRGEIGSRKATSIHCHLSDALEMGSWMRGSTLRLRTEVISRTPEPLLPSLYDTLGTPERVFFIHYGKAGGVYSNIAFKKLLRSYRHWDSWVDKPGGESRDWNTDELTSILESPGPGRHYLHQHHVSISSSDVERALSHGWKTAMFYRDPRDLICSLFHWGNQNIASRGFDFVFMRPSTSQWSFDAFFDAVTQPEWARLWALPFWASMVDHVRLFSPASLDEVCEKIVGAPHTPHSQLNSSSNPGWVHHLKPSHLSALEKIPHYQRSIRWVEAALSPVGDPDLPLPIECLLRDSA